MTPILDGCFVFYDDEVPMGGELPTPSHLTPDETSRVGWIVEWFAGHTKASTKYPNGRCRWFSEPKRPVDLDSATAHLIRRRTEHREDWDGAGPYTPPTYRLRNVYTGAVVMGDLLVAVASGVLHNTICN